MFIFLSLYTIIALFITAGYFFYSQLKNRFPRAISVGFLWSFFIASAIAGGIYAGLITGLAAASVLLLTFVFGKIMGHGYKDWSTREFLAAWILAILLSIPCAIFLSKAWAFSFYLGKFFEDVSFVFVQGLLFALCIAFW